MVLVWEPITDLPEDWSALTDRELGPLLQFWNDQRADLEQNAVLAGFTKRLAREWSIETGQVEGVYYIDRGVTETLIERGINADFIPAHSGQKPPEVIAAMIQDHLEVLEGLFQFVRGDRPLSKGYIHELHAALLRHQETTPVMDQFGNLFESKLIKGSYKERPNNPKRPDGSIHQYCPPEQVDPEMERLIAMNAEHKRRGVSVEVESAWLHHRFAQIHPYQDGNGRVARALASLVFIKAGWFPLVVTRDDRPRYIDALEVADEGDLRSLVSFFVDVQKRALFQATQAAADVQPVHTVDEAIQAAKRVLVGPSRSLDPSIWLKAKTTADHLIDLAETRLKQIAKSLAHETGRLRPDIQYNAYEGGLMFARSLPYKQNRDAYQRQIVLSISGQKYLHQTIGIEAVAVGSKFRGLIAMAATFSDGSFGSKVASKEPFQVNYAESYESAERRFRPWLEESLVNALTLWRKSL